MNILYYSWNENSSVDITSLFDEFGFTYKKISYPLSNYDSDLKWENLLHRDITAQSFDFIFTFNYFPILSNIAQAHKLPYVSWVYDCPHLTLYSTTITNPYNYLFLFDKEMHHEVVELGALHAFHLPLAVNTARLNHFLSLPDSLHGNSYSSNVSFIGALYDNNPYRQISYLPKRLRGFLDGLMSSQQKIWGYSLLSNALTDDILKELLDYIILENNPNYLFSSKDIILHMLESNITYMERCRLLQISSLKFPTDIYSGSNLDIIKGCFPHLPISYESEVPNVYIHSKINLNISLRSIHQGIPLRCLDIMGAGGFLLSNLQPELIENFIPEEEFVYYDSEEDMMEKMQYYLYHEHQRQEIAENGWKKIQTHYSYPTQFEKILKQLPL